MNHSLCLSLTCTALLVGSSLPSAGEGGSRADYERAASLTARTQGKTFGTKVDPHWVPSGDSFWYRKDLPDGKTEFVLVNAATGQRSLVEDPSRLPKDPEDALKPRASSESTSETHLRFINQSGEEVQLF